MLTAATTTATVGSKANASPISNTNVHADAYIAEREEKRLKGIDIPQHRHYRGRRGTSSLRRNPASWRAVLGAS